MKARRLPPVALVLVGLFAVLVFCAPACRQPNAPYVETGDASPDGGHRVGGYQPWGPGISPAGATGEVQLNNGAGGLSAATNVKGGSSFLSFGTTPATAGNIRASNATTIASFRNAANSGNKTVLSTDSSDNLFVGNVFPADATGVAQLFLSPSSTGFLRNGDNNVSTWSATDFSVADGINLDIGSTNLASTGQVRTKSGVNFFSRNNAASADLCIIDTNATDDLYIGQDNAVARQFHNTSIGATNHIDLAVGGPAILRVTSTEIEAEQPIVGVAASAYSAHGEVLVAQPNGTTHTLTSSEYSRTLIQVCNALGGTSGVGGTLEFPAPSAGYGYPKYFYCGCQTTNCTLQLVGGGGATPTVNVGVLKIIWVKSSGVYLLN